MKKIFFLALILIITASVAFGADRPDGKKGVYAVSSIAELRLLEITADGNPNTYNLITGDACMVITSTGWDFFVFDSTGTDADDGVNTIRPTDYATAGNWDRLNQVENLSAPASDAFLGHDGTSYQYIYTDESTIEFYDDSGTEKFRIKADGVKDTHIDWGSGANQVDLADIPGGTAGANAFDFGGATSVEVPNGANPTTDAAGEITVDTDDHFIEIYSDASRVAVTKYTAQMTIWDPDTIQGTEDAVPMLAVEADWAPHGITIVDCGWKSDAAVTMTIGFEEWSDPTTATATIEDVTSASDVTEQADDGTLADASVAAGSIVMIDLDTDALNYVQVWFTYYVNPGD